MASRRGATASSLGATSSTRSTVTEEERLALAMAPAAASDALEDEDEGEEDELSPALLMSVTRRLSYLRAP